MRQGIPFTLVAPQYSRHVVIGIVQLLYLDSLILSLRSVPLMARLDEPARPVTRLSLQDGL